MTNEKFENGSGGTSDEWERAIAVAEMSEEERKAAGERLIAHFEALKQGPCSPDLIRSCDRQIEAIERRYGVQAKAPRPLRDKEVRVFFTAEEFELLQKYLNEEDGFVADVDILVRTLTMEYVYEHFGTDDAEFERLIATLNKK